MGCTASSNQGAGYTCDNAYDNITDPGADNEWASYNTQDQPWVEFVFARSTTIVYADVWYRCRGVDQYSKITILLADREQMVNKHYVMRRYLQMTMSSLESKLQDLTKKD